MDDAADACGDDQFGAVRAGRAVDVEGAALSCVRVAVQEGVGFGVDGDAAACAAVVGGAGCDVGMEAGAGCVAAVGVAGWAAVVTESHDPAVGVDDECCVLAAVAGGEEGGECFAGLKPSQVFGGDVHASCRSVCGSRTR